VQWLEALDRHSRIECLAAQESGVRRRFALSQADTDASAWAFAEDGRRYAAAEAVFAAVAVALDLPWLLSLFRFAPVAAAAEALYRWVSGHRCLLPGVEPYCARRACPEA
jgi:predicted DCC family thiol-disulfide oxidoreductase YuxK